MIVGDESIQLLGLLPSPAHQVSRRGDGIIALAGASALKLARVRSTGRLDDA
jgi:hypothetical protein